MHNTAMARKILIVLTVATCAGLFIGTMIMTKDAVLFFPSNLLSSYFDEYGQRCDANIQDISTHRSLPEATSFLAHRNLQRPAFFFVETSCLGKVNARQACAVESVARLHPEADVYLLLISPPAGLNVTHNPALRTLLKHYPNAQVLYVHLDSYFRNSPLQEWYRSGILRTSRFQQSHTSDVFRFFTLWKYGGTYLDLDVILTRSITHLTNFAGAENSIDIAAGVLNFVPPQSSLAFECVREIRDNFQGDEWGENGPGVITRVAQSLCRTKNVYRMTRRMCGDKFMVLPPSAFYPIPWRDWRLYFDEELSNITMQTIAHSYGIHVWNKFSSIEKIKVGSKQPYGLVAQKFCPQVYKSSGSVF